MKNLPGAISARGVTELQFNAALAKRLHASLRKHGIPSVILNPDEEDMALHERPQRAEKAGATLFISIHHDSTLQRYLSTWQWQGHEYSYSDRSSGYGLYVSDENPSFRESLRLAKEIGGKLLASGLKPNLEHAENIPDEILLDKKRGVYKYSKLVVVQRATMPAILIEAGVIVNRAEELRVSTPEYQDKIISAVRAAAADHCGRGK
jgi:N-acetylmuramoyl-L-alanine amidase